MNACQRLSCFKAYDIRGRVPDELNPNIAYLLGLAYAERFMPGCVALGHDVRGSSRPLLEALALGLGERGVQVLDLGLCGTEEVYWAAQQPGVDGAVEITASHNPAAYNGMKLVRGGAVPISGDSGLRELESIVAGSAASVPATMSRMTPTSFRESYIEHLLSYIDVDALRPMSIVVNAGNGAAGPLLDALEARLPFRLVKLNHQPDGTFPNGIPNPLLPQMRGVTTAAVCASGADFGVAWDGDFDRCFLYDERGRFIEGYYIVGLLAQALLGRHPGSKIVHDPRLVWNTVEIVRGSGGIPVQCKSGHAFMKEVMRREDALYGGELSAHHYFRDFSYCDSGMIPWLLVYELISSSGVALSELVGARMARYPASGEINRRVDDPRAALEQVRRHYAGAALRIDETDGVGIEFERWRFNLRMSNTEPLIRLNVESRGDAALMQEKTQEVLALFERPEG